MLAFWLSNKTGKAMLILKNGNTVNDKVMIQYNDDRKLFGKGFSPADDFAILKFGYPAKSRYWYIGISEDVILIYSTDIESNTDILGILVY